MNTEIKTLDGWYKFSNRTGKTSVCDYVQKGDIVSEDLINYFMSMLPPRTMSHDFLQIGEPYSHVYDIDRRLRPIFLTFAKCDNQWRFYGNCFAYETVDRTYY